MQTQEKIVLFDQDESNVFFMAIDLGIESLQPSSLLFLTVLLPYTERILDGNKVSNGEAEV